MWSTGNTEHTYIQPAITVITGLTTPHPRNILTIKRKIAPKANNVTQPTFFSPRRKEKEQALWSNVAWPICILSFVGNVRQICQQRGTLLLLLGSRCHIWLHLHCTELKMDEYDNILSICLPFLWEQFKCDIISSLLIVPHLSLVQLQLLQKYIYAYMFIDNRRSCCERGSSSFISWTHFEVNSECQR